MKVKLLKDVLENGVVKVAVRRRSVTAFFAGTEVEMSDASAQKYIEAGLAEAVAPEAA